MAGKCEHGLTTKECYVCASPKYGATSPLRTDPTQEWTREHCLAYPEHAAQELNKLVAARKVAAEQASEEGLWCIADNIVEAYLQQELRRLTAAIEQ